MKKKIFLGFIILWITEFYSCSLFHTLNFKYGDSLIGLYLLLFTIVHHKKINHTLFGKNIITLLITTFISFFPTIFILHQPPFTYAIRMLFFCIPLLYFWLKVNKFTKKDVLDVVLPLGFLYCSLMVIQQITYPKILFYNPTPMDEIPEAERNGLWRIFISGWELGVFFCYYKIYDFFQTKKKSTLIYSLIGLLTIYLGLGRIGYLHCIIAIIIIYIKNGLNDIKTWFKFGIIGICALFVISNINLFISKDMIEMTESNLTSDDYVRALSYDYYFNESTSNPIYLLMGHGWPVSGANNKYTKNIDYVQEELHWWITDIGIVGQLFLFGLINIIVMLSTLIKLIKKSIHVKYVLAYILPSLLFWIIIPIYYTTLHLFILALLMYLTDVELSNKNYQLHTKLV